MTGETNRQAFERIHREASVVTGQLSISISRSSANINSIRAWAKMLQTCADELNKLADRLGEGRR